MDPVETQAESPASSSNASMSVRPKGRAKACTNCRQVKLKCNARESWPNPCFRCKNQGSDCKMDQTFRRVPARRQLEEVSQKLNDLQRLLDASQSNGTDPIVGRDPTLYRHSSNGVNVPLPTNPVGKHGLDEQLPLPVWPESTSSKPPNSVEEQSGFLNLEDESQDSKWTLGGIIIDYRTARALFEHFNEHKWHHIPVLQPCQRIQDIYSSSELLFWTVILQATRNHGLHGELYHRLLPHHRLLLGNSLIGKYSIETLHAILLICTWPYPSPKPTPTEAEVKGLRNRDPSWMLVGVAIHMATMMGLHKPGRQEEFGYAPKSRDRGMGSEFFVRNVTWLYIFQLSTSQSSWIGISPPLCSPAHMDTMALLCQDCTIPAWMRAKADIQRRVAQFTVQLDTTLDVRTRCSLITIFEQYLDRAKQLFDPVWSQGLEIDYQGAKLYLYGIAFVNSSRNLGSEPVQDPEIVTRGILQRGLTAAVSLCHTACNMKFREIPVPASQEKLSSYTYQLSWFPKRFNLAIAFAAIFLAWFLAVDKEALESDRQLARRHMDDVRKLYATFHHSQEHLNIGRKLGDMTSMPVTTAPLLTVSSRLGASFMYSYNFMYRYVKSSSEVAEPNAATAAMARGNVQEDGQQSLRGLPETGARGSGDNGTDSTVVSNLPNSWSLPWSEWDSTTFEDLQNLSWDTISWDFPFPSS